jgi:MoaA/NifB/PqqE/SkfB family radical SAM enzyme
MKQLDFPNNIQIETTSRCNAKCEFCPYPATSLTQPQGAMDDDLFESIVEQISYHPVHLIQPFLNNDPLMDRRILQRLELIVRKNPKARVMVTTNGFLLRDEIARGLVELNLDTIHISSNGLTPEVYRETMGIDAFTVIRNVNNLWDRIRKANSATKLVVTAILLKANKHEITHMRDYWTSRGVTFYLNPLNNRAGNISEQTFYQLLPFSKKANDSQLFSYNMSGCPALYSYMGILWNGDLITCCMDWRRSNVLGNAREDSLYNLWHGGHYRKFRDLSDAGRLDEMDLCRQCGDNRYSIDTGALRDLIEHQTGEPTAARDAEVLCMLEKLRQEEPDSIKLGLLRS